ncbi:MAG: pseudouridine synthase [Bacillota bacterium]|nr:pseudouridine synthase [Bacillota bacterium]
MGIKIDMDEDIVKFKNQTIHLENKTIVVLINKPEGYVSTTDDQFGRKTVLDIMPNITERLYPIGRLDYNSCGLLLLTNDGELTYQLTHPKHHISKVYRVYVDNNFKIEDKLKFEEGLFIDDYLTKPSNLIIEDEKILRITLYEGRNRQIRKMLGQLGYDILKLERIQIGDIFDDDLSPGKYRYLSENEVMKLRREFND